jgi:hypothetical protein
VPKPLFLHRPAGLYVRFRVPADLLGVVGSRFLVRPLKMVKGDRARLVAECMAVALSEAFGRLRQGNVVDLKKHWRLPKVSAAVTLRWVKCPSPMA